MANPYLTPEEMKKIWKEIKQKTNDDLMNEIINGNWGPSPISSLTAHHMNSYPGISPTDMDSWYVYSYQEPEKDEQGTYYGYKVLHKNPNARRGCICDSCLTLCSPRYPGIWVNGELHADKEPSERSMFGIHFTKRPDHPELNQYRTLWGEIKEFLVKCALSGTIIETEQGFRAEHAQIVGVYINENWQSYSDYQERTRAYTRPNPIYEDEENGEWKVNYRLTYGKTPKGNGTVYPDFSADS